MRAIFLAAALLCAAPTFAKSQAKKTPKLTSEQQQLQDDKAEAQNRNKEGIKLIKQEKYEEAREAFYLGIQLDPDSFSLRNNYGRALLETGDVLSAIDEFEVALELDYTKFVWITWNNLGFAYEQSGQFDKAVEAYLKAFQEGDSSMGKNYMRLTGSEPPKSLKPLERFGCGG